MSIAPPSAPERRAWLAMAAAGVGVVAAGASPWARAQVVDLDDAINKAGRQRMLSQRMAKSWLAEGQGVDRDEAERTLAASMALFDRQLAELKAFAPTPELHALYRGLESTWSDYKSVLVGTTPAKANASALLAVAQRVLAQAQEGTAGLEKLSDRPRSHWVNVAGRQRMLSQRMAACYFSAAWGVDVAASLKAMKIARDEFLSAHEQLSAVTAGTPRVRDELALAATQWTFFDDALGSLRNGIATHESMDHVFTTSERILQAMDGVTGLLTRTSLA